MKVKVSEKFYQSLVWPFQMIVLLWIIMVMQWALGIRLGYLGVFPMTISGLKGIIFSPLLHADFGHLLSNTPPLFFLSVLILFFYRRVAVPAFLMIYLLSGLTLWTFGRPVYHIGASGVIYGLVAFVFWSGIFRRNLKAIVLSLVVVFYYGSMFLGILPGQEGISWEGHLLGGLVGIFTAYWFKERIEKDEAKPVYSWEKEDALPPKSFFEPDLFDKTKEERRAEKPKDDDFPNWFSSKTWR